jgi:ParB family transcriptional regulator, chromosome partitioning protein
MPTIREKLAGKKSKLAGPREPMLDHPADPNVYQDGAFCKVEIALITPDPNQPRKYFDPDSLEELSRSIEQKGVLQPVIIRKEASGRIYLVAGERRFRAAKMAGLENIPAILTMGNPMEIAMIENLQRENLKPVEEAEGLGRMVDEYHYTHEQLAFVIGKARSTITETLSLNKLPEQIKEECRRADNFPRRLLVEVAKQESSEKMLSLFEKIKAANLKSGEVREITRKKADRERRALPALISGKISALSKSLQKLDFSIMEQEDTAQLLTELHGLRKMINKILN